MQKSGSSSFLDTIARQFKRFARAMKEKPQVKLDDYVLEHFMHYHGLAGTTEENQLKFRNVRRDCFDALQNKSPAELAIALKVDPLYWQEKLEQIFEAATQEFARPVMVQCLLPPDTDAIDKAPEHVPLKHPDWRVRANAAKVLAYLRYEEAIPRVVNALDESSTQDDQRPAFLHIAYALAQSRHDQAKTALVRHLENEEPWFRVDAAGALATWPLQEVQRHLFDAMLRPHLLNDYMSVAIARRHSPIQLLATEQTDADTKGVLEIFIGLVQAAEGPFANEVGRDPMLFEIMDAVADAAKAGFSPRSTRAALILSDWVIRSADDFRFGTDERMLDRALAVAKDTQTHLQNAQYAQQVLDWLKDNSQAENPVELRHALNLAGRFKLKEAAPYVIPLLKADHPAINEVLDAAGSLGLTEAAPAIIALINESVDLAERTSRTLSKQPVVEDNAPAVKTYWHALKALAELPGDKAYQLLLQATADYAADKRQQALLSLISQTASAAGQKHKTVTAEVIGRMLTDAAASVKVAALQGVSRLQLVGLLAETAKLAGSKENGVSRAAIGALKELAASGHSKQVKSALEGELAGERDAYRRQRLQGLSQSLE